MAKKTKRKKKAAGVPAAVVLKLLTLKEAAAVMGVARWRLYELIRRGQGPPHMRLGRTIRISEAALVEWVQEQHANGNGHEPEEEEGET